MLFKEQFVESILAGKKTRTTRIISEGKRRYRIGQKIAAQTSLRKAPFARIFITDTIETTLADPIFQTQGHLAKEGLSPKTDFLALMKKINPQKYSFDARVMIYDFLVVERCPNEGETDE